MEEIWKDIKGYEGYYQVSNLGRVKSLSRKQRNWRCEFVTKEKILNPYYDTHGYRVVSLRKNNTNKKISVHRLVGKAFIPNTENKPEINHIDGNKENNVVTNLEWVTYSENLIHAWRTGLTKNTEKRKQRALKNLEIIRSKPSKKRKKVYCYETNKTYSCLDEAHKDTTVAKIDISRVARGIRKQAKGFHFEYIEG